MVRQSGGGDKLRQRGADAARSEIAPHLRVEGRRCHHFM